MKQFDEKFSRKAKEAFENYDASHLAGEGWNSYVNKYGKKRTRAIIIPLWAKVASVAAILTIVLLLTNRINHGKVDGPGNQLAQENRSGLTESANNKVDTAASSVIANSNQVSEATISKPGQSLTTGREKTVYQTSEGKVTGSVLTETGKAAGSALAESGKAAGSVLTETDKARSPLTETATDKGLLLAETAVAVGPLLAKASIDEGPLLAEAFKTTEMSAGMHLPDNPIEIRLTEDADTRLKLKPEEALYVYSDSPREKMTTAIMTGLSGMMASINNTSSTAQGISFGFYVEQQLTRRISVRPGLAMAKHNYALESIAGESVALDYNAPELNGLRGTTTSYDADIEVVSMEVPVNFVYSIRKRGQSNFFVTTGVSTVIYLNQHLSGNFNNTYTRSTVDVYTGEILNETMTTSVRIDSEQETLNRIDLLGLANFSAGYSIPFGKTSHLMFEPFVQLPLKDLTSLNMRIRYGGLSMKLQF